MARKHLEKIQCTSESTIYKLNSEICYVAYEARPYACDYYPLRIKTPMIRHQYIRYAYNNLVRKLLFQQSNVCFNRAKTYIVKVGGWS